jgi:hypothetical protein
MQLQTDRYIFFSEQVLVVASHNSSGGIVILGTRLCTNSAQGLYAEVLEGFGIASMGFAYSLTPRLIQPKFLSTTSAQKRKSVITTQELD